MKTIEKWLPRNKFDIFGKNEVVKTSLPYYIMGFITSLGLLADSIDPFIYLAIVYSFFPIMDELFSLDNGNPSEKEKKQLIETEGYFLAPLFAAMIMQWIITIKVFSIMQQMDIAWYNIHRFLALVYIISNLYAIQFVVAHEFLHRPGKFNRFIGTFHIISLYYTHFAHHHLKTHHIWVATPLDPTSPWKGETLYQFMPRVVIGSWIGVYKDQKKEGKSFFENAAIISILSSATFASLVYAIWGFQVAVSHSFMAFGAIFYLQTVSYIQHYGLVRRKLPNGQYQRATAMHSWNAPHRFTNYFLFKVQRHSDHHEDSSTPYQALASLQSSPFLPHGYPLMVLMAFFPKVNKTIIQIWFRIVDPLLDEYNEVNMGKKANANPQTINLAVTETRKFLIKVAISAFLLFVASALNLI